MLSQSRILTPWRWTESEVSSRFMCLETPELVELGLFCSWTPDSAKTFPKFVTSHVRFGACPLVIGNEDHWRTNHNAAGKCHHIDHKIRKNIKNCPLLLYLVIMIINIVDVNSLPNYIAFSPFHLSFYHERSYFVKAALQVRALQRLLEQYNCMAW